MNLDALANEISKVSSEKVVRDLSRFFIEWKDNDESAEELKEEIEKYLGNTWIEENEDHEKIYRMWSVFRDEVISKIGGMTMNERLYAFGLFERFDACQGQEAKLSVYRKLHAKS
jgi:aromatic ring hydroxylase